MAHRKVLKPLLAAIKAFFKKISQRNASHAADHDARVQWVDLRPPGWGEDSE